MLVNLKEWYLGLSRAAAAGLIAGALVILVGFISLSYWALSTETQILFADLDPQDASVIVDELDRMKIPYSFEDGGKTILVEKDIVYKTRLKLMGTGVNLKGTVGFEIFNESDFGMTDFAQRINYQRALQGEITRTIMGLEEVLSARVHIVVPESNFLKNGEKQTKASITITTKPGYKLTQEQVLGIQRLVAAAIPEIAVSAVTILDNRGVALTKIAGSDQDTSVALETKLAVKRQTEEYFTQKIVLILDKTFGPGKAIVSVDVTLNHDSLKVTREDVLATPTKKGYRDGAVIREKKSSKSNKNQKNGSVSQSESANRDAFPTELHTEEIEYVHGRQIEQIVSTPGTITRMSVGVILPNHIEPEKIEMLSKVISMSVGLTSERGDELAVYPLNRFSTKEAPDQETVARLKTPDSEQVTPASNAKSSTTALATAGMSNSSYLLVSALILIALLSFVWIMLRRRITSQRLTEDQRQKMLKDIQAWLAQPNPPESRNA